MRANEKLQQRIAQLERQLEEAEDTLRAIRSGEVDSLVVETAHGLRVYALEGVHHSYRVLVEAMNEGAASLAEDGTILYCNSRFAAMIEIPLAQVMGSQVARYVAPSYVAEFQALLGQARQGESRAEIPLRSSHGTILPALLSVSSIEESGQRVLCLVAIDLRSSEDRYRRTLENMLEGCVMLGRDLTYVFVNKAYAAQAGKTADKMIGRTMLEVFPSWEDSQLVSVCRRCVDERRPQRLETELHFGDGHAGWYELAVEPVPEGILLRSQNIGERKQAENALHAQAAELELAQKSAEHERRRLQTMMEVLPVGIALRNASGTTIDSNAALSETWCMPRPNPGSGQDHPDRAWWANSGKRVQPNEWASSRAMRNGDAVAGQLFEIERLDGSRGYIIDSAAPVRDSGGKIVGTVVANQDVTELQHELQARARIARLYAVLSRVNEAIVRCHVKHELYARVCQILVEVGGFPLAWIGEAHDGRIVSTASFGPRSDDVEQMMVTVEGEHGEDPTGTAMREGRAMVNRDFRTEPRTSPWRKQALELGFRSCAAFPLRRGGVVVAALTLYSREPGAFDVEHTELLNALAADLSFAHDAMEEERLRTLAEESLARSEAKLREADERKSQFLAVLSHELRNPLAPIKNSLYILDRVDPTGEQATRARAVIGRQVNQLVRLVDDLLDVTRLTRGKLRLECARLDLAETVSRTAEDHRPLFQNARLAFTVHRSQNPLWMQGDGARIAQVIGNLLTNAAKFTSAGGAVTLTVAATSASTAEIRVSDTGMGISSDLLPHLFEPFMQAENTLERSKGGLGLGLVLVKSVVEMHGGSVEPHSDGPGSGAEFVVRLPIEADPSATVELGTEARRANVPRRVLVIEDQVDAAQTLRDVLLLEGHAVEVAHNGPEGLHKAHAFAPDVVFCDIGLPGMSGYEVAAAIRRDNAVASAFLVALTGYAQPDDLQRAAEAGFDTHVAKPATAQAIQKALACGPPKRAPARA